MAVDISSIETALGKNPFEGEVSIPPTILLAELANFLTNERPALLHPSQQKALIPIAAEVAIRTHEETAGGEFGVAPMNIEVNVRRNLDRTLRGKRGLQITDDQLAHAIELTQQLDPVRDKRELLRLGSLTDTYLAIMRSRTSHAGILTKNG